MKLPRTYRRNWPPRLREVVELALSLGCSLEKSGRGPHIKVLTPEGKTLSQLACTPSDHRTHLNDASDLRRKLRELQS